MGMSASQANLLSLTARLHDIEFKAQSIMSEKVSLATQQDEVYQNYLRAMDATKVQVAFNNGTGGKQFVDATFNNVCCYSETRYQNYSLKDMRSGKLFVTEEMFKAYKDNPFDKYNFAWDMLGLIEVNGGNWYEGQEPEDMPEKNIPELTDSEFLTLFAHTRKSVEEQKLDLIAEYIRDHQTQDTITQDEYDVAKQILNSTDPERIAFVDYVTQGKVYSFDEYSYDKSLDILYTEYKNASPSDRADIVNKIKDSLYTKFPNDLYNFMRVPKTQSDFYRPEDAGTNGQQLNGNNEFPENEFKYYVQMWENIDASGGCVVVPAGAQAGDEANKWFNEMISSGKAVVCTYNETTKGWDEQTVASTINNNYLIENQDDTDLKKAEAEYEYNLNLLKKKDSEFDKDLSKLETEKSAIEQMMESIKTAKNENIDRTFNLFN